MATWREVVKSWRVVEPEAVGEEEDEVRISSEMGAMTARGWVVRGLGGVRVVYVDENDDDDDVWPNKLRKSSRVSGFASLSLVKPR